MKKHKNSQYQQYNIIKHTVTHALIVVYFKDFDECALGWDNCHEVFATCTDVVGAENSFICTCNPGYTGSGVTCASMTGINHPNMSYLFVLCYILYRY